MDFLDLVFLTCPRFRLALYCCHLFLAEDGQRWSVYPRPRRGCYTLVTVTLSIVPKELCLGLGRCISNIVTSAPLSPSGDRHHLYEMFSQFPLASPLPALINNSPNLFLMNVEF